MTGNSNSNGAGHSYTDNRDSIIIIVDGPADTTVRPLSPEERQVLIPHLPPELRPTEGQSRLPPTTPPGEKS